MVRSLRLGAVIVGLGILVSAGCSSGGHSSAEALSAWNAAASAALSSFGRQAALIGPQEQQWESGAITTSAFRADLAQTASVIASVAPMVNRLPAYPTQPDVDPMYRASLALYTVVPSIQVAATSLTAGPLRSQVLRISDRVRELADRTFDQGRVLTAQGLVPSGAPAGVQIELPLEVPNWVAEGLAPGPPLAATPPAAPRYPPLRQGARPTERRSVWVAAVRADGAPAPAELQTLMSAGSPAAALGAAADQLQAAVDRISGWPDPAVPHGREQSDRLRLSLLAEAEACRLAQAAVLVPPSEASVSSGLSAVGPDLLQAAAQLLAHVTVLPS
jgi:hypothetical protein